MEICFSKTKKIIISNPVAIAIIIAIVIILGLLIYKNYIIGPVKPDSGKEDETKIENSTVTSATGGTNSNNSITQNQTIYIINPEMIIQRVINNKKLPYSKDNPLDDKVLNDLNKSNLQFEAIRTELKDPNDSRIINDYLSYCDRREQLSQVKDWMDNPNSGYKRLYEIYTKFFNDNKEKLKISGNPVPLTILNKYLLKKLGRGTNQPLRNDEQIEDTLLLSAYIEAWYEKNSSSLR